MSLVSASARGDVAAVNDDLLARISSICAETICLRTDPLPFIHLEECVLSFDTPCSKNGLYTNLLSWQAFG